MYRIFYGHSLQGYLRAESRNSYHGACDRAEVGVRLGKGDTADGRVLDCEISEGYVGIISDDHSVRTTAIQCYVALTIEFDRSDDLMPARDGNSRRSATIRLMPGPP